MHHQTELLVASAFSLVTGLAVGLYALWPAKIDALPVPPSPADITACSAHPSTGKQYEFGGDYFTKTALDGWNKHLKPLAGALALSRGLLV